MEVALEEIYAVMGELVAVQGINLKRLQGQLGATEEKLEKAQNRIKELEAKDAEDKKDAP